MTIHIPYRIRVKITHFSNKIKNKQQTPYYTSNYSSSDDDDYYQPDIFAPYTQEYRVQKPRQNQASQNINFYPQNLPHDFRVVGTDFTNNTKKASSTLIFTLIKL